MPFRRSYARSSRYRRRTTRRVARRPARRTTTRFTRRSTGNRYRSRRALLNITSKKKQDNMLPYATNPDGSGGTATSFGVPSTGGVFLWNATARDRISGASDPNASSLRESDTCFMRGLKERLVLTPSDDVSWMWRRITFTMKGGNSIFGPIANYIETSRGWNRLLVNSNGSTTNTSIVSYVFDGTLNVDWFDVMTAKVDTNRVKLMSDRTKVIGSGNNRGRFHRYKFWYPMNKNLVYSNDENGETETTDVVSTLGRQGMGDYYVLDFFKCALSDTGNPNVRTLDFNPEATLYWHEK